MRRLAISGVVCLSPLVAAVALADAPLRINEFRLEQPGADTDEYIEIAGAPAESLAGLSLVVIGDDYNGLASRLLIGSRSFDETVFVRVRNFSSNVGRPDMTYVVRLTVDGERVGIPATVEIDAAFAAKVGVA